MKKTKTIITLFFLFLFLSTASAEISIKAEVDKTRQSSSMSFVKNNIQRNLVYIFILAPLDIGKFKIEPSVIKIGNKTYSTDTFEIEVILGKARPKTPLEQRPSQPEKIQPESEEPQITL